MKLDEKLIAEYDLVFTGNDEHKIFLFFRKYIKFIESDDRDFQHLFLISNPLRYKKENESFMKEFNTKCWEFLVHIQQVYSHKQKGHFMAGEATCYMGTAYEYGLFNQPVNYQKAFELYTISAQLNHDYGTYRLAQCYEKGLGTSRNLSKAAYFFRCVAKLGLIDGMHVYGAILINGLFESEKDVRTGLHFLSLASLKASKIYPYALFDMGRYYENKFKIHDVSVDEIYAFEIYNHGASLNDSNCLYRLAIAYEHGELNQQINKNRAFDYFKRAAQFGHIDGQMYLCEIYCTGSEYGVSQNPEQSFYWGLKTATKGHGRAAYILGEFHKRGFGTEQNLIKSLWWFLISKEFGCKEADSQVSKIKNEVRKMDEGPESSEMCCRLFCYYY